MSDQFKEQGGAATMDPSRLRRWIASKFMTSMMDPEKLKQKRRKQEFGRIKRERSMLLNISIRSTMAIVILRLRRLRL